MPIRPLTRRAAALLALPPAAAAALVAGTAGPSAADDACVPTTTLTAPDATLADDGLALPADWVARFRAAEGALPPAVPGGQHRTLTGSVTVVLTEPDGSLANVPGTYGGAGPVGDLTGLDWRAGGTGETTVLAFTAEALPYADTLAGSLRSVVEQLAAGRPDLAYAGYDHADETVDHYAVPLTYADGCTERTVVVEVTVREQASGGARI
ncbi:hypothetical protein ACFJIY_18075 [Pimelobacter simplex]|uniref:hypothetical protein n=1 Tax=Nocardioides simplex TaxID=2045 RepID=UPI00367346D5